MGPVMTTKHASHPLRGAGWDVVEEASPRNLRTDPAISDSPVADEPYIHLLPFNDLFPHVLSRTECWCHPELDIEDGLVTHNSADGREYYENGRKLH